MAGFLYYFYYINNKYNKYNKKKSFNINIFLTKLLMKYDN